MEHQSEQGYKKHLKRLVYGFAKRYAIRPSNTSEAAEVCRALSDHDIASTFGKLSKAGDDPAQIVREYQLVSNSLGCGTATDSFYMSLKPPALGFNPDYAADIVASALQNGHGVHFDAHRFVDADRTLELLEGLIAKYSESSFDMVRSWSFGLTLPSRWKRSQADARWAARKGVRPRVVKGDFKGDPSDEIPSTKGFLALIDLLAGDVAELAVATHDCALAREAAMRCKRAGSAVQFELFFGMPSGSMLALARELEVPVRFYVPFGDTLLVYVIGDLLTNPHKILRRSSYEIVGSLETKLARIIGAQ